MKNISKYIHYLRISAAAEEFSFGLFMAAVFFVAYLIVGLAAFMTQGRLIPRSVLPLAWFLTMLITAFSRVWSLIWKKVVVQEEISSNQNQGLSEVFNSIFLGVYKS